MFSIFKNKTNIVVIALIIVAGVAYFFYFSGNSDDVGVLSPQKFATSTPSTGDQFLVTLKSLKRIKLDGSIFEDRAFLGLQDFNTNLPDQPVGRINPFSPTGRDASAVAPVKDITR